MLPTVGFDHEVLKLLDPIHEMIVELKTENKTLKDEVEVHWALTEITIPNKTRIKIDGIFIFLQVVLYMNNSNIVKTDRKLCPKYFDS